jgi:hypothetical protein
MGIRMVRVGIVAIAVLFQEVKEVFTRNIFQDEEQE